MTGARLSEAGDMKGHGADERERDGALAALSRVNILKNVNASSVHHDSTTFSAPGLAPNRGSSTTSFHYARAIRVIQHGDRVCARG